MYIQMVYVIYSLLLVFLIILHPQSSRLGLTFEFCVVLFAVCQHAPCMLINLFEQLWRLNTFFTSAVVGLNIACENC